MTEYFIFKHEVGTGEVTLICTGIHESEQQCAAHWQAYIYGMYDILKIIGKDTDTEIVCSAAKEVSIKSHGMKKQRVFMLLNKDGHNLVKEISKKN